MKTILNAFLFILLANGVVAQDTIIAEGFYRMVLPKEYNKDQIEKEIIDRAKLNALENAFGEMINQTTTSSVQSNTQNKNEIFESNYSSKSLSFLTGKWISDITDPHIEYFRRKKEDWVSATVKGKVKEMDLSPITGNSVYGFLTLAYSANEIGNTRKAIDYLETYFQNETSYFIEPHRLYLSLMNDEDRQDEAIDFYKQRYESNDDIFNEFLYLLASDNNKEIMELSLSNPNFLPAKLVSIQSYISNREDILYEEGCQKYELMESYYDFLNSKYYNDLKYFLSRNYIKEFISENDKSFVRAWSNQRKGEIKTYINYGRQNHKTKDEILQDCITSFKRLGCSKESVTLLFNKLYEK